MEANVHTKFLGSGWNQQKPCNLADLQEIYESVFHQINPQPISHQLFLQKSNLFKTHLMYQRKMALLGKRRHKSQQMGLQHYHEQCTESLISIV